MRRKGGRVAEGKLTATARQGATAFCVMPFNPNAVQVDSGRRFKGYGNYPQERKQMKELHSEIEIQATDEKV